MSKAICEKTKVFRVNSNELCGYFALLIGYCIFGIIFSFADYTN